MSKPVFRLKDVPEDEAAAVRELLCAHDILYYETPPGNWGISVHALWLRDNSDFDRARSLIDEYQQVRFGQPENPTAADDGSDVTRELADRGIENQFRPGMARRLLFVSLVLGILYFSIRPFLGFGG